MSKELEALRQKLAHLSDLQQQLQTINQRIDTMGSMLPSLEQSVQDEQADVDRMESGGITSFVYGILGRQEEKLEKERQEAKAAKEQYQSALRTLQELHRQKEMLTDSIAQLGNVQQEYQRHYDLEREKILGGAGPSSARLRQLEEDGRQLRSLEQELIEAQDAGDAVMDQINRIRKSLGSASTWGTIDLFTDGFFADMAKYSHMDDAQAEMQELNRLLRRFSKELQDVDAHANLSADIGSGMVILFSIITCGIYGIYWYYTAGGKVGDIQEYDRRPRDSYLGILYLVLDLLGFGIVSMALIQNELNKVAGL